MQRRARRCAPTRSAYIRSPPSRLALGRTRVHRAREQKSPMIKVRRRERRRRRRFRDGTARMRIRSHDPSEALAQPASQPAINIPLGTLRYREYYVNCSYEPDLAVPVRTCIHAYPCSHARARTRVCDTARYRLRRLIPSVRAVASRRYRKLRPLHWELN